MLISENMLVPSPTKVLEGIEYIEESYSPAMIPVTENSRLGKYVVSLEDINSYCENTSADPGYIVSQICETNNIPVDDIAFSVTQESIILQDEVAKNAIYLMNEGAEVLAKPVVHDALYDVLEEDCARVYQGLDPIFIDESYNDLTSVQKKIYDKISSKLKQDKNLNTREYQKYEYLKAIIRSHSKDDVKDYLREFKAKPMINRAKRRKEKDEEFAWKLHDNPDMDIKVQTGRNKKDSEWDRYQDIEDAYGSKRNKIDAEKEKMFKELENDEPLNHTIDKMNNTEKLALDNEKANGLAAIDRLNYQDELASQKNQYETKLKLKDKKLLDQQKKHEKENRNNEKIIKENEAKIKQLQNQSKQAMRSNNRGFIAKIIARLNAIARKYREKYKTVKVSGPKTAIQRVIAFISKCVASLTAKLHSLTR